MAKDNAAAQAPETREDSGLRRSLTLRDLIVYGLLFIGPIAPMGTFGVLDARSGGAIGLVFVVATLAMAFTAWSYARMSRAVPLAGSVFAYAAAGLGRRPGFIAGWMIGLDYLFIPSMASLFTGIAAHQLIPAVPVWVFTLIGILIITGLNLAGVKTAAIVGFVMLAIEVAVLAVFVVAAAVVLARHGAQRPWLSPLTGLDGFDLAGILGAVSVAVLAFLGFDAIASFAEETTGSNRQVSRALQFCLALAGALFVVQTYLGALLSPLTPAYLNAHQGEQGTAFYQLLDTQIGTWFGTTVTLIKAVGPVFSALVAQAAVSRLMFGMARDGALPKALATVDPRTRTPRTAVLVSAVFTILIAIAAAVREDGLEVLSSMVTVGALVGFLFLHAAVIGYYVRGRRTEQRTRHIVVPVVGAVIIAIVLALAAHLALAIAAVWLAIGVVVLVIRESRRQDPQRS
ncbi:APC family permease [Acidipropionibacterium acidipropionici]|uniref:Amino acid permease n=1 Tax=Acidipropionibacterium acidipropionici TaxID=1748 RepID=A0AAC9FCP7_9ACTN|nr:amino acid permease [Acidipropionibacterium acidipropionici]AOZ48459.1 amino acid permease [Acidipropionibacterium acidipropionici]AZP39565.1 APC family permease [Acidipropionibacterium acidipropionici]